MSANVKSTLQERVAQFEFYSLAFDESTGAKYYASCDIREKHEQGIPNYRGVSLLSCGEGENNWGRRPTSDQNNRCFTANCVHKVG